MEKECELHGDGKHLLLSQPVNGKRTFSIYGGVEYKLHKDIFAKIAEEIPGLAVHGGGRVEFLLRSLGNRLHRRKNQDINKHADHQSEKNKTTQ